MKGTIGSGEWADEWGIYQVGNETNVRDYVISNKVYEGQSEPGIYIANEEFGKKEVVVPAKKDDERVERFYVMALEDFMVK